MQDIGQLRRTVASVKWFHQIDLGGGLLTPGIDNTPFKIPKLHLPDRLDGLSVLDIGAWDGAMSFECERRGAARVVASDWFCWQYEGKRAFEIAWRALGSRVEILERKVEDLSAADIGTFDVVLFLGVLYHAPDPLGYLRRVRELSRGLAIIETLVDAMDYPRPAMAFYPGAALNKDSSNFFGPNQLCCEAMIREVGFQRSEKVDEFYGNRMVFHAWA